MFVWPNLLYKKNSSLLREKHKLYDANSTNLLCVFVRFKSSVGGETPLRSRKPESFKTNRKRFFHNVNSYIINVLLIKVSFRRINEVSVLSGLIPSANTSTHKKHLENLVISFFFCCSTSNFTLPSAFFTNLSLLCFFQLFFVFLANFGCFLQFKQHLSQFSAKFRFLSHVNLTFLAILQQTKLFIHLFFFLQISLTWSIHAVF